MRLPCPSAASPNACESGPPSARMFAYARLSGRSTYHRCDRVLAAPKDTVEVLLLTRPKEHFRQSQLIHAKTHAKREQNGFAEVASIHIDRHWRLLQDVTVLNQDQEGRARPNTSYFVVNHIVLDTAWKTALEHSKCCNRRQMCRTAHMLSLVPSTKPPQRNCGRT